MYFIKNSIGMFTNKINNLGHCSHLSAWIDDKNIMNGPIVNFSLTFLLVSNAYSMTCKELGGSLMELSEQQTQSLVKKNQLVSTFYSNESTRFRNKSFNKRTYRAGQRFKRFFTLSDKKSGHDIKLFFSEKHKTGHFAALYEVSIVKVEQLSLANAKREVELFKELQKIEGLKTPLFFSFYKTEHTEGVIKEYVPGISMRRMKVLFEQSKLPNDNFQVIERSFRLALVNVSKVLKDIPGVNLSEVQHSLIYYNDSWYLEYVPFY